uniref:Uncharacterized protein n=1 Tax=Anopheles christyi TaxID=43041 RepID=A0A182KIH7_9DIPT
MSDSSLRNFCISLFISTMIWSLKMTMRFSCEISRSKSSSFFIFDDISACNAVRDRIVQAHIIYKITLNITTIIAYLCVLQLTFHQCYLPVFLAEIPLAFLEALLQVAYYPS